MIIYIRHSHDDEKNATHDHDAHITEKGHTKIRELVKSLISKYGYPDRIYCSPFARARETLKLFREALKIVLKGPDFKKIKFKVDNRLSRYFTSDQQRNPSIRNDTKRYDPPIYEEITDFIERLKSMIDYLVQLGYGDKQPVVWCLSHGLSIKKTLLSLKLKSPESVPFLAAYPIRSRYGKYKLADGMESMN